MSKAHEPQKSLKEDFELWLEAILDEGYDVSNLTLEDLCYIYANELLEDYEEDERLFKGPYSNISQNEILKEKKELTPYEFWKSFIEEEVEDEIEDEYLDEIEEDYEPTSYEIWKEYLNGKYILEAQVEGEEEVKNPTQIAYEEGLRRARKQKLLKNLDAVRSELEQNI